MNIAKQLLPSKPTVLALAAPARKRLEKMREELALRATELLMCRMEGRNRYLYIGGMP